MVPYQGSYETRGMSTEVTTTFVSHGGAGLEG